MTQRADRSRTADRAAEGPTSTEMLKWNDVTRLAQHSNPAPPRRVEKTDAEWRQLLTGEQFRVACLKGTESAHSSEMCRLFEPGRYHCVCCDTVLFDASSKYQSHSGWPSVTQPLSHNVIVRRLDESHGMRRTQTACAVCDTHLGHVFPDGPTPGGLCVRINTISVLKVAAVPLS